MLAGGVLDVEASLFLLTPRKRLAQWRVGLDDSLEAAVRI
jgi:hypothetical protein